MGLLPNYFLWFVIFEVVVVLVMTLRNWGIWIQRGLFLIWIALLITSGFVAAHQPKVKSKRKTVLDPPYFSCTYYNFEPGDPSIGEKPRKNGPLQQEPSGCLDDLRAMNPPALLLLQGRVDHHELLQATSQKFGTNTTLAYDRAAAVRDSLGSMLEATKTILLSDGPQYSRGTEDDRLLARDRRVELRAYWDSQRAESGLSRADGLTLLTLTVALSAYLATVGLFLRERMSDYADRVTSGKKGEERDAILDMDKGYMKFKSRLRRLALADAPLVASALLLLVYLLIPNAAAWTLLPSIQLMGIGIMTLFLFHMVEWVKSGHKWLTESIDDAT